MKLGIGISISLALALTIAACHLPSSPAPTADASLDTLDAPREQPTCVAYCAKLRKLGCFGGTLASCVTTCENVELGVDGVPLTDLHLECVTNAENADKVRTPWPQGCGTKCEVAQ